MKHVIFFVGPEKTGTTSLHHLFNGTRIKEQFFLSRKGDLYDEIKRIENTNSDTVFLFEPSYFASEKAFNKIRQLKTKYFISIVFTYREPISRSYSHYLHHKNKGRCRSFTECLEKYPEIIENSKYEQYLQAWNTEFNVFTFDIIRDDLKKLYESLDLNYSGEIAPRENIGKAPRNQFLIKYVYYFWDGLHRIGVARLVPLGLRRSARQLLYRSSGTEKQSTENYVSEIHSQIAEELAKR